VSRTDRFHKTNPKTTDKRNPFPIDRDRLLYSSAFRHLSGVTQVISAIEGEITHNRLTHSLKVAQVSRRLTEQLQSNYPDEVEKIGGIDPDVTETSALAHDLGHPPFGHVAEEVLNECVGAEGYEGNAQTFRIINKLCLHRDKYDGLNLTKATLNAVLKYPWLKKEGNNKWGAYKTEKDIFGWVRNDAGDERKSPEAEIMDWADDITYAVHDLEDFVRAGLIPLFLHNNENENKDEKDKFLKKARQRLEVTGDGEWSKYENAYKRLGSLIPFYGPYVGDTEQRINMRKFTSILISRYINVFKLNVPRDNTQKYATIPDSDRIETTLLKQLTWHYVIENPSLAIQQFGFKKVIKDLFQVYNDKKNDRLVPPLLWFTRDDNASQARIAADIVSSMTDSQALNLHKRLFGISPGSVSEWL
jgi:dGTPase